MRGNKFLDSKVVVIRECICGKLLDSRKQELSHRSRCVLFKEAKSDYLETIKEDIISMYETLSLPSIISNLEPNVYVSYSSVASKLREWGVVMRNISQAKMLPSTMSQTEATNILRYGGTGNPLSKGSSLYYKRNKTVLDRYGTTTVFGSKWFKDNIISNESFWLAEYGSTRSEFKSKIAQKVWHTYSDESRKERCINARKLANANCLKNRGMLHTDYLSIVQKQSWDRLTPEDRQNRIKNYKSNNEKFCGGVSRIETQVLDVLETLCPIIRQKWIRSNGHSKNYDAHIIGTNVLVEINGDYWHANPLIYNTGEYISYPGGKVLVDSIWDRDKFKKDLAESFGYKVISIWENDINHTQDIAKLLMDKIPICCAKSNPTLN